MSLHAYSRIWLHLVWTTLNRERMLLGEAAPRLSAFLAEYAKRKDVYMRINYVNPEHVHTLIDLPAGMSVEEVMQLLKGASSHWVNAERLVAGRFAWGRGYGCFSVSESNVGTVVKYIAGQAEHHRLKTFTEEIRSFNDKYGLQWREEETVQTVSHPNASPATALKRGANKSAAPVEG